MATTPTLFAKMNIRDKDDNAYKLDANSEVARIVCDSETHRLLGLLGGTGNTTPTQFNVVLGLANTEQSQALPANTKEFVIKARGNSELKLAYSIGESNSTFITVPKHGVYTDSNFYSGQTIYFQSPQTGDTIEIVAFV